jgi:rhodanese-related sulfurtransferase
MRLRDAMRRLPLGSVPEIGAARLATELRGDAPPQVLDVRSAAEWRFSRIPGARRVSVDDIAQRLPSLGLDASRKVVAICLSAHRSIPAVRLLREAGFHHAVQLRGGMLAWWAARLPTEHGSRCCRIAHPAGRQPSAAPR